MCLQPSVITTQCGLPCALQTLTILPEGQASELKPGLCVYHKDMKLNRVPQYLMHALQAPASSPPPSPYGSPPPVAYASPPPSPVPSMSSARELNDLNMCSHTCLCPRIPMPLRCCALHRTPLHADRSRCDMETNYSAACMVVSGM